jgi:sporulation protein YlmC with PRC-barrel domain
MVKITEVFGKTAIDTSGIEIGVVHDAEVNLEDGKIESLYARKTNFSSGKTGIHLTKIYQKMQKAIDPTKVPPGDVPITPSTIKGFSDHLIVAVEDSTPTEPEIP